MKPCDALWFNLNEDDTMNDMTKHLDTGIMKTMSTQNQINLSISYNMTTCNSKQV